MTLSLRRSSWASERREAESNSVLLQDRRSTEATAKLAEGLLSNHGLPVDYLRQGDLALADSTKTRYEYFVRRI